MKLHKNGSTSAATARMLLPKLRDRAAQPLRFAVVGASGVLINTAVLWLLVRQLQLPLLLATALATEVAVISNFLLNNAWTFRAHTTSGSRVARFARFNLAMLGGLLITALILALLMHYTRSLVVANIIAVGCATCWNYIASSRWAWRAQPATTTHNDIARTL